MVRRSRCRVARGVPRPHAIGDRKGDRRRRSGHAHGVPSVPQRAERAGAGMRCRARRLPEGPHLQPRYGVYLSTRLLPERRGTADLLPRVCRPRRLSRHRFAGNEARARLLPVRNHALPRRLLDERRWGSAGRPDRQFTGCWRRRRRSERRWISKRVHQCGRPDGRSECDLRDRATRLRVHVLRGDGPELRLPVHAGEGTLGTMCRVLG